MASAALKEKIGVNNVEFKTADFFDMDGSFDLIYDYTWGHFRSFSTHWLTFYR